jgi:hypothetical protein
MLGSKAEWYRRGKPYPYHIQNACLSHSMVEAGLAPALHHYMAIHLHIPYKKRSITRQTYGRSVLKPGSANWAASSF